MNPSDMDDRAWVIENIPAIGEINARIFTMLDGITNLPNVLCGIVMDYFEGLYVYKIIDVMRDICFYKGWFIEWRQAIQNIVKYKWESHDRIRQFDTVINFLGLSYLIWERDTLDTEIMNYLSSIHRVDCTELEYNHKCGTSIEMINAIYILIFIIMQKCTNSSLHNNMPVWHIATSQFVSLGFRAADVPMYPTYDSDD